MKAVVDIGTNTIRMLIGEAWEGKVLVHAQFIEEPRLGVGITCKRLTSEAVGRTVQALEKFKKITEDFPIEEVKLVATSAVRDAVNGKEFVNEVQKNIGWQVQVISGKEEAELSYLGAVASQSLPEEGLPVVIDIGGGSTEVIFPHGGQIQATSVNVGAVRLSEAAWPQDELAENLFPALGELIKQKEKLNLVAVGGTATTAATIHYGITSYCREAVQGKILLLEDLKTLKDQLALMSEEERNKVIGLTPKRADIIVPGMKILVTILEQLGASKITVSDAGILDGLLLQSSSLS